MTPEQIVLLSCLSDLCHGTKTEKPAEAIDLSKLFELANDHCLAGLLYDQCHSWFGLEKAAGQFRAAFLTDVFCSVNRADMLQEIADRFRAADISFICMKGSVFRDYYPIPGLRSMGDLDFIIHPKDREKSDKIMMSEMGCERLIDNHSVWTYWIDQFMFEIHDNMFYEYLTNRFDYRSYFNHVWEHVHHAPVFGITAENMYVPDENFHFLYLMAHTAKHIINSGSGLRAYLDMALMVQRCADRLDWTWIQQELEKMGLLAFTFALCERWFRIQMPLGHKQLDDSFLETVTQKTFYDGVFGLDNSANQAANSAKEVKRAGAPYWITAVKLTTKKLFTSYRDMQLIPWYSFVDGHPWLMPAAWIYRWGYCAVHKRKRSVDILTEPFLKRRIIGNREALIRDWGL